MTPLTILFCHWMMACSWVLSPSYQGTLLSFFFFPFTQTPMDSLGELRTAMRTANVSLGVTEGSSSHGVISTGGGIYADIWGLMQRKGDWEIDSVESGLYK